MLVIDGLVTRETAKTRLFLLPSAAFSWLMRWYAWPTRTGQFGYRLFLRYDA